MTTEMRVGVVGAGVTGLSLTHYLAERGVESVAFEASDQPGGVIDSRVVDGRVVEAGPQRLRLTDSLADLVETYGLRDQLRVADDDLPLYVYADGGLRVVPRSLSAFLRTDLLSWRAKGRLLAEPLTADADPGESIASLCRRKFGDEVYENLVHPILGGTFGSDPATMPTRHALSAALRMESAHGNLLVPVLKRVLFSKGETPKPASFDGGLQALPRAIADAHADRVALSTPVAAVHPDDDGVLVETDAGTERFDEVVLTTDARATADLLASSAPDAAAALRELTYNSLALVYLDSDADARGFGYQVRRTEPLHTLGVSWNASLFDRDGLYTAFFGGMDDPEVLDRSDDDLGALAASEFETVMGADSEVLSVARLPGAFPAYDGTWAALDDLSLPENVHLATNYTARMGIPARVREASALAAQF
ncbi:MAG: protoporphyrinogen oxidase [Haloarculaceae archaeon]